MHVSASVFKAYDIRGIVGKTIDERFAEQLGRAFGSEALAAFAGRTLARSDAAVVVEIHGDWRTWSRPASSSSVVRCIALHGIWPKRSRLGTGDQGEWNHEPNL